MGAHSTFGTHTFGTSTWLAGLLVVPAVLVVGTAPAASAANFFPAAGAYVVNTTTLKLTGPGTDITGTNIGGVATFSFDNVFIPSGTTLNAIGARPFALKALHTLNVAGTINADGTNAANFSASATPGGAGGAAGGTGLAAGDGSGGGKPGTASNAGSSGGGFGGVGARGGEDGSGQLGGAGGASYGDLNSSLVGGSGGGGNTSASGGGGGGAIGLYADDLTVASSGVVRAVGGDGAVGSGASGGGSGGGIVLHGNSVEVDGAVFAFGGAGGNGGCCGDGGGGGGGRVNIEYLHELILQNTPSVFGGASGAADPQSCGCGTGHDSPDAAGAAGVYNRERGTSLAGDPARTINEGTSTLLKATLKDATVGAPLTGVKVSLYKVVGTTLTLVGSPTTGSTGVASARVKPTAKSSYQWKYPGDSRHQSASSKPTAVRVAQVVAAALSASKVAHGSTVKLYGWVNPVGTGQSVTLQRLAGTTWTNVTTATLKSQKLPNGTTRVGYVFSRSFTPAATVRLRVVKNATATLARGISKTLTLTVT